MRALAVVSFGAEPNLMDLPKPVPAHGEVLVRMSAAGVNPLDWKIAAGRFKGKSEVFPLILGVDGAGRVEAIGPGVQRFRPGDRIFGQFLHEPFGTGTYAEYAVVPEQIGVSHIPEDLPDREAAAVPTAGMEALVALDELEPAPGSTLLVVGASGGVGSFVIQLAHARGVRVIAVAKAASANRLLTLGASNVVDVGLPEWEKAVRTIAPNGVDAALDVMSDPAGFRRTLALVRPGGRAGSTGRAAEPGPPPPSGVRALNINLAASSSLLDRLARELLEKGLKVPVERTIALEDAPRALAEIRAGRAVGKVVIVFLDVARALG